MVRNILKKDHISKAAHKDIILDLLNSIENGKVSLVIQDKVLIQINLSESFKSSGGAENVKKR